MPQSILDEGMHADHATTVATVARRAAETTEPSPLRAVIPAAAAIAVATAASAQSELPKKAEGPAIHKDLSSETVKPGAAATPSDRVI